ncbi:MAG: hypothetical protein QOE70_839 [Chthoniobacter sp.]|jgi:rhomboid family GlyGly-CTERM serine protease|nr:hypothetical protein [Chthoniobacter sp.]
MHHVASDLVAGESIRAASDKRAEMGALFAVIAAVNLPLLVGGSTDRFAFLPGALGAGQWWRLFTHPFAHVSIYHLLLDGAAFLLLYATLDLKQRWRRIGLIAMSAGVSLAVALAACPQISQFGLRGLSGIAHGLMAVTALETMQRSRSAPERALAIACFVLVLAKSWWELMTGGIVMAAWHAGPIGTPIAACHAGGLLGALLWMAATGSRSGATVEGADLAKNEAVDAARPNAIGAP